MKIRFLPIFMAMILGAALVAAQEPATVKIDSNNSGKSVAAFSHAKHSQLPEFKNNCAGCHHNQKKDEKPKKCSACHTSVETKDGVIGFKEAFHKNCLGCHQKQKDKADLKKCTTCHGKS